jgi:hypothetical protein
MIYLKADTAAEVEALEAQVWIENIRWVANTYWDGYVKDVSTGEKHKADDLTNIELNDRERFPLFGYIGGSKLNTKSGFTYRWAHAAQSTLDAKFYMPKPTDERVLGIYDSVKANHPGVVEADIDPSEHWPSDEEAD